MSEYLHGFSEEEQIRLVEQAKFLAPYIFRKLDLSQVKNVLEVGMGVGAETVLLLEAYPHIHVRGLELSEIQIEKAKANLGRYPQWANRWSVEQADARQLDGKDFSEIDLALIIWVLEHIPNPLSVLQTLHKNLKPGTLIHITEVCHGSLQLYPACPATMYYWNQMRACQLAIQGAPDIGYHLGNMLHAAGFKDIQTWPCEKPNDQRDRTAFLAMMDYWENLAYSALDSMLADNWVTPADWDKVQAELDMLRQHPEAMFFYHSMQALARS